MVGEFLFEECCEVLKNLCFLLQIDYQVEDVLVVVVKREFSLVVEYLCD